MSPIHMTILGLCLAATFATGIASATAETTPYAGQDRRTVSTLSVDDIAALEAGRGWGLALPAELNGYPGPMHVLEHADSLRLSDEQRSRVEAIFTAMQARAQQRGADYIAAERALDTLFLEGTATPEALAAATARSGEALAALRAVHLAAHLEVTPLLTRHQRHVYADLRGYAGNGAAHDGHTRH